MFPGDAVILACLVLVVLFFVAVVYFRPTQFRGTYSRSMATSLARPSPRETLRESLLRYDHKIFDKIPDNLSTKAKLKILLFMEAEAKSRFERMQRRTVQERERFRQETARVEELEFELQKTRRSMVLESRDDPEQVLHLINKRGKEMFGEQWSQSVQGEASLEEWVIESKLPHAEQNPNIPKLNLQNVV